LLKSQNVENAWQYSKVYNQFVDNDQNPTSEYFEWAKQGWNNSKAVRYPMGKGAIPLFSFWDGHKYSYVEARKKIYAPLYALAVERTLMFDLLQDMYKNDGEIWLWDFDSYDYEELGMTFEDVINCEDRKMGHSFVLAMMLENKRIWNPIPEGK